MVARLANSLGVALINAEGLRAMRERSNNPDAVDLWMRGTSILASNNLNQATSNDAMQLFERGGERNRGETACARSKSHAVLADPNGFP